jgi:beta-glucosidase
VAGDEVVEVYLTQPKGFETPRRVLAGFTRVHLAPHAATHVSLTVDPRSLGQVDAKGNRVIVPGEYVVTISSAQPEDSTQVLAARFRVTGTKQLDK